MNPDTPHADPQTRFYDLDYPWAEDPIYEACKADPTTGGLVGDDVEMLRAMAKLLDGPVLDMCCGTGRLSIPLARDGKQVTAVDISKGQIERFHTRLKKENKDVRDRITIHTEDACTFDAGLQAGFAFIGFNSLNLVYDVRQQMALLNNTARHVVPNGFMLIELLNPFTSTMFGNVNMQPLYIRNDPETGIRYTKSSTSTPLDGQQTQTLTGVYDVIEADDTLKRYPYSMKMRHIFPHEAKLMMERVGLEVTHIWGGFREEPYTIQGRKLIVVGRKRT